MTVNEYITMDLLLPLAGGLAGAALYHLLGPMLRGCIAAARFASFLCGWAIEAASQRENARAFAWDVVYGKEPASQPFDRLRSVESELIGLACHAAKANVRITALEERMGKVEEIANTRVTRWASAEDVDTIQIWPSDGYVPYAFAGRPCPKPTKDLRPGDEVSVKMKILETNEKGATKVCLAKKSIDDGWGAALIDLDRFGGFVSRTWDDLDAMRTDNK